MSATKEIQLGLAAFLDSDHARRLAASGVGADDARRIAEAFLAVAFEEVGKHPRFFDGDDLKIAVAERMPGCFAPRDPTVEHAPAVLEALIRHLEESEVVVHAFEMRRALDGAAEDLVAIVRAGASVRTRVPLAEQKPFVHGAPKLGRNDPCSCGSGKKYKKCHGKEE